MILSNVSHILFIIGNNGPFILFVFSIIFLKTKPNALYYYVVGFIINFILNIFLKGTIQQPRPKYDDDLFKLTLNYLKKHESIVPFDIYGMPSGHAQSVIYSTLFVYLVLKNTKITLFFVLISLITLIQRVEGLYHTIFQVIVGSFVGILVAYLFFCMYEQKMAGNLSLKKDDFAPF
jgi:membrane-associated phospholipid phosphatase